MLCVALIASLQGSPWDFKPGSWVEMACGSTAQPSDQYRVGREEVAGPPPARKGFSEGLEVVARRAERWQDRVCEVVEYRGETCVATAWVVAGLKLPARELFAGNGTFALPPDVVRAIRVEKKGERVYAARADVVDLAAAIDSAGRTFTCVVETSASRQEGPGTTILKTRRRWLSAEVPGHVVRQERQCTADPLAVPHVYTSRDELRAFHVER